MSGIAIVTIQQEGLLQITLYWVRLLKMTQRQKVWLLSKF